MNITKENILAKVNSYDILNHYLLPYHKENRLIAAKNISNPFLADKQETPSFNIFPAMGSGEWRYKDFATGDDGSCFDLVMKLKNLSFPEALSTINADMNLFLDSNTNTSTTTQPKPITLEKVIDDFDKMKPAKRFSITKRNYNTHDWAFWEKFKINKETLDKFNVVALECYSSFNKEGKPYEIKAFGGKLMYAYDNGDWSKIYKPFDEKKYKFQFLGIKEANYIFGWKHLPVKDDLVFITGGEKDVLCLVSNGFNAITLNSETSNLLDETAQELKKRFKNVVVLYDNDATGIKQSQLLASKYQIHRMELPKIPNNGKDVSDYFAQNGTIETFRMKLQEALNKPIAEATEDEKVMYNAVELMEMGDVETRYLIEPIFPQKGSAVIAGKPDTGKSQFARQLCIQVALGIKEFIGFEINPIHNKSIYIATEDNLEATRFLLSKQVNGLGEKAKENLRFMFADTMEQEEILTQLENALTEEPADLVVVDSFGDIFKGGDTNNNMAMRNTVKSFDKIAKQHNCLILFVHHINKGAYRVAPGQEHIQGGAGLVQKVRLAIQLSEGENNIRYFTVVKGNYCPKEYKQNSLELNFSEETFLFSNTGRLIPTADLGTQPDFKQKEEKYNELEEIANTIFGNGVVSTGNFVKQYCQITGKSIPTAKRAHANLIKFDIIEKCNGVYRLKNNNSINNEDESDNDEE
ncbi:AAA family ATPase [Flavobacterium sp.]|uniref:AAA family ATPase n=1 Tax=Flavobacterium sp. TaxID=239 RepID=UPI003F699841